MERTAMQELFAWKNEPKRKPLIIHGARQVGKTWLMKEFGKKYFKDVAYINLDGKRLSNIFTTDYNVERIIAALQIEVGKNIEPQNTLIILDEIQEVPEALTALKYFYEEAPEYAVVAAGSLLGVSLHGGSSFPIGKVDFLNLYPLDMVEFLLALGEDKLVDLLTHKDFSMVTTFEQKYIDYLKLYYFVGGMPEAVQTFLDTRNLEKVRSQQINLLNYYASDFSKHVPINTLPRLSMIWNSIPSQLAKENKKFIYGLLREGARAKEFETAIQWLVDAGLIHKCFRIKKPGIPLKGYMEISHFKIYLFDVGLLCAMGSIDAKTLLAGNNIFEEFKGALTEQFVAQETIANFSKDIFYFSEEKSQSKVDFLLQDKGKVIPLEVKAEDNLRAKSLRVYCAKYKPEIAYKTSLMPYKEQDWVTNIPLYALGSFLKSKK